MILFFVGIIELVIAAYWTKAVSKANVALTGMITTVNIFIWYYVIRQVVEDLDQWHKIIPYVAGCAIGAMLGAASITDKVIHKAKRKVMHFLKKGMQRRAVGQPDVAAADLPH